MSLRTWFATPRVRRGLSASIVVLAAGGLVLLRTPADARSVNIGQEIGGPRLPVGPNTVQFSGPNTSVTSTSFGVITSQANAPRQLQFGLKFLW